MLTVTLPAVTQEMMKPDGVNTPPVILFSILAKASQRLENKSVCDFDFDISILYAVYSSSLSLGGDKHTPKTSLVPQEYRI